MLSKLKHTDGAIPGKKLKRKSAPTNADEIKTKRKTYEENKRKRDFKKHWQIDRKWLVVDEVGGQNDAMRCITCQSYWEPKIESLKPDNRDSTESMTDDIAVMPESAAASAGEPTTQPQNLVTTNIKCNFETSARTKSF